MNRILTAFLLAVLVGCGPTPAPQPPQPPPSGPMAVVVHDFITPELPVEGVRVSCNNVVVGLTNDDGYLGPFQVTVGYPQDCAFSKEGYFVTLASHVPGPGNETLRVSLTRMPPPHPNPPVGKLRIEGNCFRDDSGCVNPVYEHFGDALSIYARNPDRVRTELDKVMRAGYRGIRVWAVLGFTPFWAGREVGPGYTDGYWGIVENFLNELKSRSLMAVWSMGDIGKLQITREAYMLNLANIDARVGVIEWLDCGNEAWQTGEPNPDALSRCVSYFRNAGGRALLTLTSPPGELPSELNTYSIPPADAYDVHGYRDGRFWDKIRHIFSIPYEGRPQKKFGIQSESWGHGDLVSVTANKEEIDDETYGLGVLISVISRQAWIHFSGEGVQLNRGLDTEPGFANSAKIVALLPKDVATYDLLHHSGDTFRAERTFIPSVQSSRIDGRSSSDGRIVQIIYGPSANHRLTLAKTFSGKVCNPATLSCTDVTWSAGSQVTLDFTRGRLFIGTSR